MKIADDAPLGTAFTILAEQDPQRPAITCDGVTVTRGELERRSNRLARALADRGVTAGSFVTIGLPNGVAFYETALAAWKLGATPQPISSRLPPAERDAILELARPSLVVGVPANEAAGFPSLPADFTPPPSLSDAPLPPALAPSLKAPTSGGSTGRPKLIVATQPAEAGGLIGFARLLRMVEGGTHLATGPLHHNAPFLMSMCALFYGNHVIVMKRFDAAAALALVARHRVDWMYAVPTMMLRMWRLPEAERNALDLSSLRIVFHLAAPCPPWLKEAFIGWLGADRIWELYAATEVQAVTVISGEEWLTHRGSVGRPVIGEIRVLAPDGAPCPPGTVGEVWMRRGPGLPSPYRYIGAVARTRPDGWESVGDMGHLDAEGYLYLADRQSDMILVGGANVYPAEVEAVLESHQAVRSACVIGLPDEELGNVPHAIVQLSGEPGSDVSDEALRQHCRTRLSGYKVPRTFERVEQPLRDDAGKVRRSALRAERLPGAIPVERR
jgi:bile acid-coenzyme A ligase